MSWYWISAGLCVSGCICHLGLALKRPIHATYLSFAVMMAIVAPFQLTAGALHAAASVGSMMVYARYGVALAILFMTSFAVFVRFYSGVRVPRLLAFAFLAVQGALLIYDLATPMETLFAVGAGATATRVPFGPVHLGWQGLNVATAVWGAHAGARMALRGRRRQGAVLAWGASVLAATIFVDFLRNVLERDWPFVGGFGVMAMALVLSAHLAMEFRNNEDLLARMLTDVLRVRDQLNTPLQTLHIGLEVAAKRGQIAPTQIARLQRSVARLIELSQRLRARAPSHS